MSKENESEHNNPINDNNNSKEEGIEIHINGEENNNANEKEEEIAPNLNNIKEEKNISDTTKYLKDKISKINLSRNALNGINEGIDKQLKNIESDIMEDKILMTEVPKKNNIGRILSYSLQKIPKLQLSNFEQKNKYKTLKDLKEEKDELKNKLSKIITNEKLFEKEENHKNGVGDLPKNLSNVDQNIYDSKKRLIKNKKDEIMNKIDKIDDNIKEIISSEIKSSRKERIRNYIDNFDKDKEAIELRVKKYFKETKERNKRLKNDLNKKLEKMKKEIDDNNKKEKLKKEEIFKKFKEQEKLIVNKRVKKNSEKVIECKSYLKKIPKENIVKYLFEKKEEEFKKDEQNLIDKENLKRKERMKINFNEINEFEKNVVSYREKFETENSERKKKLLHEWKERKNALPTNIGYSHKDFKEEQNKEIEKEELKKQKFIELKQKRISFGYNIKNTLQPEINEKLKNQRIELIKSIENPTLSLKEKILTERKRKEEESTENKKIKKIKLKVNNSVNKVNNNTNTSPNIVTNNNVNVNKKILSPVIRIVYPFHPNVDKKIDYLTKIRIEKEKKKSVINKKKEEKSNNTKWIKALNNNEGNVLENINMIKEQARVLDDEVKMKEQILKLNGGMRNNPEFGQKISNLIINSIGAKLSILNKFKEE